MTRSTAYLLLSLGTFFWGVSFVVIKQGTETLAPAIFLAWRYGLASLVLGLLCLPKLSRSSRKHVKVQKHLNSRALTRAPGRSSLIPGPGSGTTGDSAYGGGIEEESGRKMNLLGAGSLLGLALFAGTMTQTLGLAGTSASNAGFIAGTALLFVPGFRYLLEGSRPSPRIASACLLALAGLGLLTLRLPIAIGTGDLWVLASAVAYALHMVLAGPMVKRHDPLLLSLLQLLVCFGLCSAQALLTLDQTASVWLPATPAVWIAIGFTGLLATAFPYAAQNFAQQRVEAHHVALIFLLEPVFASLAGHLVLHEPLSPRLFAGGGLILAAMLLAELPLLRLRIPRPSPPAEKSSESKETGSLEL